MASIAILAIGTALSINEQRKAGREQKRQNKIKGKIAATKRMRDIKRSVAAARVRRGEIQASGFGTGISGGSAVAGAAGSLQSDLGSSIGASNQQFTGQQAIAASQDKIAGFQQNAATFGAVAQIGGALDDKAIDSIGSFFS